jgi:hypothetical protein
MNKMHIYIFNSYSNPDSHTYIYIYWILIWFILGMTFFVIMDSIWISILDSKEIHSNEYHSNMNEIILLNEFNNKWLSIINNMMIGFYEIERNKRIKFFDFI